MYAFNPLVSIIIPTYDRADSIARAIMSALSQTFRNIEVVVVDDCSRDETRSVVAEIDDERLRYIRLNVNSGVAAARNEGVKIARGSWVSFLDSDDIYHEDKTSAQLDYAERVGGDLAGVCGRVDVVPLSGQAGRSFPADHLDLTKPLKPEQTLTGTLVFLQSWLMKKAAFDQLGGFDERISKGEDRDLLIRFLQKFQMSGVNHSVATIHESRVSLSKTRSPESTLRILTKHKEMFERDRAESLNKIHIDLGIEFMRCGNFRASREVFERVNSSLAVYYRILNRSLECGGNLAVLPYVVFRRLKKW